jgi:hypothetical protein
MTTALLRAAEDELQKLRGVVARTVAWIHDPSHDRDARIALAQHLGLPNPEK